MHTRFVEHTLVIRLGQFSAGFTTTIKDVKNYRGILMHIRIHSSPNFDERPDGILIDTIVLHATVLNTLAEVIQKFADPGSKVSAHYTIDRDATVVSHVAEENRAWHAGQSKMKDGRSCVNDFSIGIELVNLNDGADPFPIRQIEVMRELVRMIIKRHPIQYIVPHYECAYPRGRKSDPAGFNPAWIADLLDAPDDPT